MKLLARLKKNDSAVSPVIAVILMVAITVVLAATVYVWVSGFGASPSNPAKTMSLTSAGAITGTTDKSYTVSAATAGMRWNDLTFTLNGVALTYDNGLTESGDFEILSGGSEIVSADGTTPSNTVTAGQTLVIHATSISGQTLRVLDTQANSVILTLTVG